MKTYLLREPKAVERQSVRRAARTRTATAGEVLGRPARVLKQGLDALGIEVLEQM